MTRALVGLLIVAASALAVPAPEPGKGTILTAEAVKLHLQEKFSDQGEAKDSGLKFAPKSKVVELDTPTLRKYLPKTRFFQTKLDTAFFSYPEVETVIAVTVKDGKITSSEALSPIFTPIASTFLSRFRGLKAKTAEEQKALGSAIGELFKGITYEGELRQGRFEKSRYSIELWHSNRHWRNIVITFDSDGQVISVTEDRR